MDEATTGDALGMHEVDAQVMCSITRFGLRHSGSLLPSYLDYRRLSKAVEKSPPRGLLQSVFLVENPATWYSMSIWRGIPMFSAQVGSHVDVARRSFERLRYVPGIGPELWTTRWRLVGVSNNLNWPGLELNLMCEPPSSNRDHVKHD